MDHNGGGWQTTNHRQNFLATLTTTKCKENVWWLFGNASFQKKSLISTKRQCLSSRPNITTTDQNFRLAIYFIHSIHSCIFVCSKIQQIICLSPRVQNSVGLVYLVCIFFKSSLLCLCFRVAEISDEAIGRILITLLVVSIHIYIYIYT